MTAVPMLPFECPAKWEQNIFTHSPGSVVLSATQLEFRPGSPSVVGRMVRVSFANITRIRHGDNFLWRGVVKVDLRIADEGRQRLTFFVGGKRAEFLARCRSQGIEVV